MLNDYEVSKKAFFGFTCPLNNPAKYELLIKIYLRSILDISALRRRHLKTQQSPVILDLCLRKTRSGKSRDYRDVIVFKKNSVLSLFRPHLKAKPAFWYSPGSVEMLWFRNGLVWTVGPTKEIMLRFEISPAWCGRRGLTDISY